MQYFFTFTKPFLREYEILVSFYLVLNVQLKKNIQGLPRIIRRVLEENISFKNWIVKMISLFDGFNENDNYDLC